MSLGSSVSPTTVYQYKQSNCLFVLSDEQITERASEYKKLGLRSTAEAVDVASAVQANKRHARCAVAATRWGQLDPEEDTLFRCVSC